MRWTEERKKKHSAKLKAIHLRKRLASEFKVDENEILADGKKESNKFSGINVTQIDDQFYFKIGNRFLITKLVASCS